MWKKTTKHSINDNTTIHQLNDNRPSTLNGYAFATDNNYHHDSSVWRIDKGTNNPQWPAVWNMLFLFSLAYHLNNPLSVVVRLDTNCIVARSRCWCVITTHTKHTEQMFQLSLDYTKQRKYFSLICSLRTTIAGCKGCQRFFFIYTLSNLKMAITLKSIS